MAHITKSTRNGTVRWRARYLDPDGREREKWFARRIDAQQWLTSTAASIQRGEFVDPAAGRRTFGEVASEWQAAQVQHDVATAQQIEARLRIHALPALGDRPIGSIRPSHVQAWVADCSRRLAPTTVKVTYRHVGAIFRAAVRDGVIAKTPCVGIKLPVLDQRPVVPPSVDQVWALHEAMPPRFRAMVILAAGTGLRIGEVFGLTLPNVEFLRRTIRVTQQLKVVTGRPPFLADPKTTASYRTVPAAPAVLEALARHLEDFPPTVTMACPSGRQELLVFSSALGKPLLRASFTKMAWGPARTGAGLPGDFTFHGLRHFYASLLIRQGLSVKAVQARLGHTSATVTLDTYGHLWPDDEDRARDAVEAVLGAGTGLRRGTEQSQRSDQQF